MIIKHLNYSDINGGAARAAYRIHRALNGCVLNSRMMVNQAYAGDWTVECPATFSQKVIAKVRSPLGRRASCVLKTSNPILHSPSIMPSRLAKRLNRSDVDVVHLHWVNGEMMSITDIGKLRKPLVWTLHDMWAFSGAEHYSEEFRWRDGYTAHNRPEYESRFDLNRWTWNRKRKHWNRPFQIVTPSHWLADCVRESALMRDWPVTTIHNCIDTEAWQPVDSNTARHLLQLPADVPLLLFGAMGGAKDPRKGFDLLKDALQHLRGQVPGLQLVVFGQRAPKEPVDLGFPVHYTGHLHDDVSLRLLYSAADALVIPSRQDNLPNTGVESLACGTPVIAFNTCGLPDLAQHLETGWLANAFDTEDLARGIQWVLEDSERLETLGRNARAFAVEKFSYPVVAAQYKALYERVLAQY